MAASPVGSVVIPAWNEEAVIGHTLRALVKGIEPADVEIIVACNGCTDATAQVAAEAAPTATILDLPSVGKIGAIRAGEAAASVLPRIYLDADVILGGASALAVLSSLAIDCVAARPPVRFDTSHSSWLVRRYYRQRARLPQIMADLCGAGVYGLSAAARSRFGSFPDVVGDDLYAARIVDRSEVTIVPCEPVTVVAPRDVRSLVRTVGRAQRGNRELARNMPDRAGPTWRSTIDEILRSITGPRDLADAAVYIVIAMLGRLRTTRTPEGWARDESSRMIGR